MKTTEAQRKAQQKYRLANPDKVREAARRSRELHPHTERRGYLKRKYGLTPERFEELLILQEHKCAICKTQAPGGRVLNWTVDHDHETGEVRGLLCSECNWALGGFKDDPLLLEQALRYLINPPFTQIGTA